MKSFICIFSFLLLPLGASADSAKDAAFLRQYFKAAIQKSSPAKSMSLMSVVTPLCPGDPAGPSCVKTACAQGGYDCHFSSGLDQAITGCRGVEGACVEMACREGGYDCHFSSGLDEVLTMCKGANGACVKTVCAQGGYDCHFSSGLDQAMKGCHGILDASCISDACTMGGQDCHFTGGLDRVLELCRN